MFRVIEYFLYLFIFLIPWQARWVIRVGELNPPAGGGFWEYGTISVYATDILFLIILLLVGAWLIQQRLKLPISNSQSPIKSQFLISKNFVGYWELGIGYLFLSIFWSFDKPVSLYAALKLLEGIVLFLLIRALPIDRNKFIWAFVASAVVQSTLAIAQFFTQSVFAWPFSGIAPKDPSDLGVSVVQFADERWLRAYGSFPHPNLLGAFIALALLLMLRQLNFQFPISNFQINSKFKILNSKFLLLGTYCLLLTGLFFTFSRAAWIAFLVGLVIYAIQTKVWRDRFVRQIFILLTAYCLLLTAIFFPLVRTRIGGGSRLEIQSNQERTTGYREAVQLIKRHPFFGVGIGNYTIVIARELRPNDPVWSYQPAHNVFLLILSELGIIGFILLLGFLWQTKKFSIHNSYFIIPLITLSLFDHSFWTLHSGTLILCIAIALTVSRHHHIIDPYGR